MCFAPGRARRPLGSSPPPAASTSRSSSAPYLGKRGSGLLNCFRRLPAGSSLALWEAGPCPLEGGQNRCPSTCASIGIDGGTGTAVCAEASLPDREVHGVRARSRSADTPLAAPALRAACAAFPAQRWNRRVAQARLACRCTMGGPMNRRETIPVHQTVVVWLILCALPRAAWAQCARAECPCPLPAYSCKLDGSDLCTAVIGVTSMPVAVSNVVRIRNKYRINTPFVEDAKILFSSRYTYNPPNPPVGRGYPLDAFYDRVGTIGFFLDNSDYFNTNLGRVSMMSSTSMFPVALDTIDCSQLPHVHANAQTDISGKDVTIEYVKGGTFTQTAGWPACQPQATGGSCPYVCNATTLPAGLYQIWNATVTFDGVSYPVQLAMPDDNSNPGLNPAFVDPNRLFNFRTEFFESGMFVQFLLWDMQVQSDGSSTWVPVTQFKQEEPAGSTFNSAGVRVTVYNNRPVLEVSNDGSDTYHFLNDQFSIPADVSGVPSAEPRIEFTDSINWVFNDQSALTLVARLNRTSTSDVNVALKITGTAAGMSY